MKMKNQNYIKLVFISLLITSCFLFPKPKKQGELNIKYYKDFASKVEVNFKEGNKEVFSLKTTFLNTNINNLLDINDNQTLKGLDYSFVLAPITIEKEPSGMGFGKILSLEVKEEMKEKIKVRNFYFVNKDGSSINLNFAEPSNFGGIPHREDSQRKGYAYAYNRGFINWEQSDTALGKTINAYYDYGTKTWRYMYLKIFLEKEFEDKSEYIVKINPYIFNELVKHFKKTYIDNNDDQADKKAYENILNEQIPSLPVNDN